MGHQQAHQLQGLDQCALALHILAALILGLEFIPKAKAQAAAQHVAGPPQPKGVGIPRPLAQDEALAQAAYVGQEGADNSLAMGVTARAALQTRRSLARRPLRLRLGSRSDPMRTPAPGASPGHPASVRERSARADLNPPSGSGGTQYWTLLDCRLADQISFALQTGEGLRSIVVSVCASWPEREWPRHVDEPDLAGMLGRGTAKDRN